MDDKLPPKLKEISNGIFERLGFIQGKEMTEEDVLIGTYFKAILEPTLMATTILHLHKMNVNRIMEVLRATADGIELVNKVALEDLDK